MDEYARGQQLSPLLAKKNGLPSLLGRRQNVLGPGQEPQLSGHNAATNVLEESTQKSGSQVSKRKRPCNALELARALCVVANVQPPQRVDVPKTVWNSKRRERIAAVFDLLGKPEWKANLDAILSLFPHGFKQINEVIEGHQVGNDTVRAVYALQQCQTLAGNLTGLVVSRDPGYEFFVREERRFRGRIDSATGKVSLEPYSLLGPYQDAFLQALHHPNIDARRFQLCHACSGFFYQPRRKSRACSRKCEDVLMSREHYQREKDRGQRVLELQAELRAQGKPVSAIVGLIAVELGVRPARIRRYLKKG